MHGRVATQWRKTKAFIVQSAYVKWNCVCVCVNKMETKKIPRNPGNVESCLLNNSWWLLFVYSHTIWCVFMTKNWIVAAFVTCQPSRLPSTPLKKPFACSTYYCAYCAQSPSTCAAITQSCSRLVRCCLFARHASIMRNNSCMHQHFCVWNLSIEFAALSFFALVYLVLMASLIVSPIVGERFDDLFFSRHCSSVSSSRAFGRKAVDN